MKNKKFVRFGLVFLVPLSFVISQCFRATEPAAPASSAIDPRGVAFAGSASCVKCHSKVSEDYFHTNHFLTSRPASLAAIPASFKPGSNFVDYTSGAKVIMEKVNDSLFQSTYNNGVLTQRQPFNIIFGSKQAETFLYWHGKFIFELPVTYYKNIHQWANSPGFNGNNPVYTRLIGEPCFECHSSYIEQIPPNEAEVRNKTIGLAKSSMLLGIDCERCHGPAAQHVKFHIENPAEKKPFFIMRISSLSRSQRTDLCAQCHSGINRMTWSTFDFKPGDTLLKFKDPKYIDPAPDTKNIDVHGNQVGLLTSSKCFIKGSVECGTCHNTHQPDVKSLLVYSQICTNCHSTVKHNFGTATGQLTQAVTTNCIDCHMPAKSSIVIASHGAGNQTNFPFLARMHRIAVYPEETKKVLTMLKNAEIKKQNLPIKSN